MLEDYLADLKASLTASPIVKDIQVLEEFITSVSGYFEGRVQLVNSSVLYVSEYFTIFRDEIKRDKYSYHLQKNDELLIRWDSAPHHRELSTFPFHVHGKDGVLESKEMTVEEVLIELSKIIE